MSGAPSSAAPSSARGVTAGGTSVTVTGTDVCGCMMAHVGVTVTPGGNVSGETEKTDRVEPALLTVMVRDEGAPAGTAPKCSMPALLSSCSLAYSAGDRYLSLVAAAETVRSSTRASSSCARHSNARGGPSRTCSVSSCSTALCAAVGAYVTSSGNDSPGATVPEVTAAAKRLLWDVSHQDTGRACGFCSSRRSVTAKDELVEVNEK